MWAASVSLVGQDLAAVSELSPREHQYACPWLAVAAYEMSEILKY